MNKLFIERLEAALTKAKMTQAELSRRTGVPTSRICRYLKGEYEPKSQTVFAFAKALNVSPSYLEGYGDNPSPDTNFVNLNLSYAEYQILVEYRLLNEEGKGIVNDVINSVRKRKCLNRS